MFVLCSLQNLLTNSDQDISLAEGEKMSRMLSGFCFSFPGIFPIYFIFSFQEASVLPESVACGFKPKRRKTPKSGGAARLHPPDCTQPQFSLAFYVNPPFWCQEGRGADCAGHLF